MSTLADCVTKPTITPGDVFCAVERELCVVFTEERKRLVRTFDERQGEAEEVVSCSLGYELWKSQQLI